MTRHRYLSTACRHRRGADCRRICKFCPGDCCCRCHRGGGRCARTWFGRIAALAGGVIVVARPSKWGSDEEGDRRDG